MTVPDFLPMGESGGNLRPTVLLDTNIEDPTVVADPSLAWEDADMDKTGTTGTRGRGGTVSNVIVPDIRTKVIAVLITHDTIRANVNGHPDLEDSEEVCHVKK